MSHRPLVSSASLNHEYLSLLAPNLQRQEIVKTAEILPCAKVSSILTSGGQSRSPQALSHPGSQQAAAGQQSSVEVTTRVAWGTSKACCAAPAWLCMMPTSAPGYLQVRDCVRRPAHQSLIDALAEGQV